MSLKKEDETIQIIKDISGTSADYEDLENSVRLYDIESNERR